MTNTKATKKNESTAITVVSTLLFLLVVVVFGIQLSIIISYFITNNFGRCVYLVNDSDNENKKTCYCDYTTNSQCDKLDGVYNDQLDCQRFAEDCRDKSHREGSS
jgi:capsular polysaccharide biosynthesis protein